MKHDQWIALAALLAGLGVVAGAFGAHALEERLLAGDHLATWETAARYQLWHALGLFAWASWRRRRPGGAATGWCFLVGTLLFSGSLYALSLDVLPRLMGPLTPLGGSFLIAGWAILAVQAWRAPAEG